MYYYGGMDMKKKAFAILLSTAIIASSSINCFAFDSIQKGTNSDSVKEVQQILIDLGYLNGTADGDFGGMTEEAVMKYQSEKEIEATGVVDEATYNSLLESKSEWAIANAPEGMIIGEEEFDAWKLEKKLMLMPFGKAEGFTFTVPEGQADSKHKTCDFLFKDGDSTRKLENVEFYYCVDDQQILYTGFDTTDESILDSDDFREACVRLMLGYNSTFNKETKSTTPNISRERAEEIVNYCLDNKVKCIVDDMRIRVVERPEDSYYSFHIEY